MYTTSEVTGVSYYTESTTNILNTVQVSRYLKHGAKLLDVIIGRDDKLVFVFDRESTQDLYIKWLAHELN